MEIEACPWWKEEKKMVRQPYEDGVRKLNVIIAAFQNRGLKEPENFKILLIKMFWQNLDKKHLNRQLTISVKDVFNWCNARWNVPVEEYTPCKNNVQNKSPALTVTVTVTKFRNFQMATPTFFYGSVILIEKNLKWGWNGILGQKPVDLIRDK
ncbi:hypothetical protein AVEN_192049-1 [Araneus ventricosus]|uniref:Uncharacterized protein n=1 Tax=Araneus ventricosus TaxID=182803 RepID=A0A4Y2B749_ARAVE|nr:hypothetical protein AVEN_192049-1 [Araneus ventricosus]